MDTFVRSKEFHRRIRQLLAPWAAADGLKRLAGSSAGWKHEIAPGMHFLVWCQLNKWGDADSGNSFCVNVQLASEPVAGTALVLGDRKLFYSDRIADFFDAADREAVWRLNNLVRARKPRPGPDHWAHTELASRPDVYRFWLSQFEPIAEPYAPNQTDLWLEYYDGEDVERWGEFLLPRLPRYVRQFLAREVERGVLPNDALKLAGRPAPG